MKLLAKFLLLVASASLLGSCSGSFDLRPGGRIGDVTFSFFQSINDTNPPRFRITDVYVEKRSGSEWELVWVLRGDLRLDTITYAHEYPGLHTARGPEQLVRGGRYRVGASGAGLYAGAEFTVDSNGYVIVSRPTI